MRGTGSTAFSDLLDIDGVQDALGLSYRNSEDLNKIIDKEIPIQRPSFTRSEVVIAGESFDLYKRDIIECIRALYGSPEHAQYLCVVPERHYSDADKTCRLYHDMYTGKWWWSTQKALEKDKPGATVVPVILSSDKTLVTLFRNKSAYPVYLTIGNLPKEIRRKPSQQGQILLGYLPTTKLDHIKNKSSRRRTMANLFHACMKNMLSPLKDAGLHGIMMQSGDGVKRRCHPILAAYVADYPEQVLVTCTYSGDCSSCECPKHALGEYPCPADYRDYLAVLEAVSDIRTDDWVESCRNAGIKPVQHPFWEDLPYTDIFRSITPDILHQLYQGVMKHLIGWLVTICGDEEFDARVRRLPLNHGIRNFHKGVTTLSRVTGAEHKQICAVLLGLIVDAPTLTTHQTRSLLTATRSLLDFLYLACYPIHTEDSLASLEEALHTFHQNKSIFVSLGAREHFNFPKIHFLCHYTRAIRYYGTTDNYNTETTERLHIDFAKDAYRASNRKDEYAQMTKWLERREKIQHHSNYITWRLSHPSPTHDSLAPAPLSGLSLNQRYDFPGAQRVITDLLCPYQPKLTKRHNLSTSRGYGATKFHSALTMFIAQWRGAGQTAREIEEMAQFISLPFKSVPVWHQVKFVNRDLYGETTLDVLKAQPRKMNSRNQVSQSMQFDTALVQQKVNDPEKGHLDGLRIGRIRVIFSLPSQSLDRLFPPNVQPPSHLAYVEWFTKFTRPETSSGLYRLKLETLRDNTPSASVVPLETLKQSVHLFPKWGGTVPNKCITFYLNPFRDPHTYCRLEYGKVH
ncbi:hypothetical protein K435DRAFT_823508 [Dendrothele bispora CBS 962.96]|uniref:Uncharacterized protein n=1 Tax=Dendrothele bispora (strain CBS 962.96) TaxID=1314807 RepID=A0A4S8KZF4_DENBC|nr:hypothetical protein K435DRAFT_823508 [Dendrothele bispora CBS 962.96]